MTTRPIPNVTPDWGDDLLAWIDETLATKDEVYAAGTDRCCVTANFTNWDPDTSSISTVDWRGKTGDGTPGVGTPGDPYITAVGDGVIDIDELEATGSLTFLTDGVYNVKVHSPHGFQVAGESPGPFDVGVRLGFGLVNEYADGDDAFLPPLGQAVSANYTWVHKAGDVLPPRFDTADFSPFGPVTFALCCQIVKLSNLPWVDESEFSYRLSARP